MKTPMKAIRAKYLDCSNLQVKEIRDCAIKQCALYPYRMGKRPKKGESITEGTLSEKTLDSLMVITKKKPSTSHSQHANDERASIRQERDTIQNCFAPRSYRKEQ